MSLLETYRSAHQNPKNKFFHILGIPTIVIALVVMFWNFRVGMGLFLFGWLLQFAGHLFEKKPPSFIANPIYLLVGPYWWAVEMGRCLVGGRKKRR